MTRQSRATALLAAAGVGTFAALAACGGSTGREGLPISASDATSELAGPAPMPEAGLGTDATVADTGQPPRGDSATDASFDATIEYADAARLPDVSAPRDEAGAAMEAGGPPPVWTTWPVCTCEQLDLTKFQSGVSFVDSGVIVMDDAGGCRTQVWTRSQACDDCLRNNGYSDSTGVISPVIFLFPPCCDLARDAGFASTGPAKGTGETQFELCAELFECLFTLSHPVLSIDAYCGAGVSSAACQSGMGQGPCRAQIEAAKETTAAQQIVNEWAQQGTTQGKVGSEGEEALALYKGALQDCPAECFPASSSSGDASPDGH